MRIILLSDSPPLFFHVLTVGKLLTLICSGSSVGSDWISAAVQYLYCQQNNTFFIAVISVAL